MPKVWKEVWYLIKQKMKTDSRMVISIDKKFFSDLGETIMHVWFNHQFHLCATLTMLTPSGTGNKPEFTI